MTEKTEATQGSIELNVSVAKKSLRLGVSLRSLTCISNFLRVHQHYQMIHKK